MEHKTLMCVNQVEMKKNEGHVLNETHSKWEIILYSHFVNTFTT
jgi:hypothetical protein